VLAGIVSAWLAGALYAADGALTPLDVALAIAAPAGSVSAALLNGVFAYGESAVAKWQAESSRPQKRPQPGGREGVRPSVRLQDQPQASGRKSARPIGQPQPATRSANADTTDTSPALAGHLAELREKLGAQRQSGARNNGTFKRKEVEALLGISTSYAKNIVSYGLEHGVLEQTTKRHARIPRYQFTTK
jgi:hypothetical protein